MQSLRGLRVLRGFGHLVDEFSDFLGSSAQTSRVFGHAHGQAFLQTTILASIPRQNRDLAITIVEASEREEN